jgi:hypothetical protein
MTIATTTGPRVGPRVIASGIADARAADFRAAARPSARARAGARAQAAPHVARPFKRFVLHVPQIKGATFLRKARQVGWRYILIEGNSISVADVSQKSPRARPTLGAVIDGSLGRELVRAAEVAMKRFGAVKERFEARMLEVPALYVSALWLHSTRGRDVFIRLFERGPNGRRRVSVDDDFVGRLKNAAVEARAELRAPARSKRRKRRRKAKRG